MDTQNNIVVLEDVFVNYEHLFEPYSVSGYAPKYGSHLLALKENKEDKRKIDEAIDYAIKKGGFDTEEGFDRSQLKLPLRDGDVEHPFDSLYQNCYFLNATSSIQPEIYTEYGKRQFDPRAISKGDYVRAMIEFVPYDFNGNKGVSCKLHAVQSLGKKSRLLEIRPDVKKAFNIKD